MIKIVIINLTILLLNFQLSGQTFDKTPLKSKKLEKGLLDFNYLRQYLIESGFEFRYSQDYWEKWGISKIKNPDQYPSEIDGISIEFWRYKDSDKSPVIVEIYIRIFSDFYAYADQLIQDIKINYPESNVYAHHDQMTGHILGYNISYGKSNSKFGVTFQKEDNWYIFHFLLFR